MASEESTASPAVPEKKVNPAKLDKFNCQSFDVQCKEVRGQLAEQLKAFGDRTEVQVAVLTEFEDFLRKRGEIEAEHAAKLEKLARSVLHRQKSEKNRREGWGQHAVTRLWQEVVDSTRTEAECRTSLASLLTKHLAPSAQIRAEDLQRQSKKCRDIGALAHAELQRVMSELQTAMKTYQIVYGEMAVSEKKMSLAQEELDKSNAANANKSSLSRKQRSLQKELAKRSEKYVGVNHRCTKARNEYVLCVQAANSALHKFFADDLSSLADGADLGMDFWLQGLVTTLTESRKDVAKAEMSSLAELEVLRDSLNSGADKQQWFESRPLVFMLPKPFELKPCAGEVQDCISANGVGRELQQRRYQIQKRLDGLRFESDEVYKSLEASERQLATLYEGVPDDVSKWKTDVAVTTQYYLKKLEYFILNGNLIERLQTRAKVISSALGDVPPTSTTVAEAGRTARRPRRIVAPMNGNAAPKLFGNSLQEYCEVTGEEIPLIVTSTVGFLSRYALRHQGLFRVSGAQSEINRYKEAFEKGDDLVSELLDASEANCVAGVLKAYLRELREPPFPTYLFDQLTDAAMATERDDALFIKKMRDLVFLLPTSSLRLLRFLFGFLSHLCQFSDENMMEPHNVAICLGPTLLPIPESKDQVYYHNFVNEVIRGLIIHWESVFPTAEELPGVVYDKFAYAREEPFSYADEEGEGEETDDDTRRSGLDTPLLSHFRNDADYAQSPSMYTSQHTDIPTVKETEADIVEEKKEAKRSSVADAGEGQGRRAWGERPVWETSPLPPPLFTSLREQLHHSKRAPKVVEVSPGSSGVSSTEAESPVTFRPSSLPPPPDHTHVNSELRRIFGESDRRSLEQQPDVVRACRESPSPLPPLHSPTLPRPVSPAAHIEELTKMLATLRAE